MFCALKYFQCSCKSNCTELKWYIFETYLHEKTNSYILHNHNTADSTSHLIINMTGRYYCLCETLQISDLPFPLQHCLYFIHYIALIDHVKAIAYLIVQS